MCLFDELILHHLTLIGFLDHIQDHLLLHLFLLSLKCAWASLCLSRIPLLLFALLLQALHLWSITLSYARTTKLLHTLKHRVLISSFHRLFKLISLLKSFHSHYGGEHVFWLFRLLLLLRCGLRRLQAIFSLRRRRVFHQRYAYMVTL